MRKNCCGFASDACGTLSGKKNALNRRLKKSIPHIIHLKDMAHALNTLKAGL